jgi:curved DNA-binding protein CbpA
LGVSQSSDKKQIKQAYYEAVGLFHPDKYFGKKVGAFKPKLERVFARLTEAHDVLTHSSARQEYDQYLATLRKNVDLERLLSDERERAAELERARQRIEEQVRVAERASQAPPPRSSSSSVPSQPIDSEARKRALARKLGLSAPPPRSSSTGQAQIKQQVADDLKRRYEQRLSMARDQQIEYYVRTAEQSILEKPCVRGQCSDRRFARTGGRKPRHASRGAAAGQRRAA